MVVTEEETETAAQPLSQKSQREGEGDQKKKAARAQEGFGMEDSENSLGAGNDEKGNQRPRAGQKTYQENEADEAEKEVKKNSRPFSLHAAVHLRLVILYSSRNSLG